MSSSSLLSNLLQLKWLKPCLFFVLLWFSSAEKGYAQPSNDLPCNAINIGPGTYSGNNIGANTNASLGCGGQRDVWYRITGTGTFVSVNTCGPRTYDTYLGAFSSSLSFITCNDDACGLGSSISFFGQPGVVYYIAVGGWVGNQGSYTLAISGNGPAPAPPGISMPADMPVISATTLDLCPGASSMLSIASGNLNDATEWRWYRGSCGGTSVGTGSSINVSPSGTTTYFVRGEGLCVSSGSCAEATITVTPLPAATITPTGPTTFCPGSSVNLTASAGASWLWSNGATTQEITVNQTGNYSVTVTNAEGCSATSDAITITVEDNLAPVPDVATIPTLAAECSVTSITAPTATDNCAGPITATTTDPTSYTAQGNYVINWKFDDGNGNITMQEQAVKIDDITPPYFDAIADKIIIMNPAVCKGKVPNLKLGLTGTDNCGGTVTFTQSVAEGDEYPTTHGAVSFVTITADDGNGNTFSRDVKLISKDDAAPEFTCPSPRNVSLNSACSIVVPNLITGLTGDAKCGTLSFSQNPIAGTVIASGHNATHTVVVTANDGNGNSTSCDVTLTAIDVTPPVLVDPSTITQTNDAGVCNAAVIIATPGASDNCTGTTVAGVRSDAQLLSAVYPVGNTTITWTATDAAGLKDTYVQTITVTDDELPHVITKNISRQLSYAGTVNISAADVNNGSWDNCGIQTLSVSPNSFNCSNLGNNTVTLTITDIHGNVNAATATINITALQATTNVTVTPSSQQYSDLVTFVATVDPGSVAGGCTAATSVTFMIGTQSMGTAPLVADGGLLRATLANVALFETPDSYQLSPGNKTVTAVFNGKHPAFIITDATTPLTITPEDARADYTGAQFVGTSCNTCATATVTLSATIRDITAVTGSGDADRGDIRKARVKFVNRDNNADISGWLTPGLVTVGDIKTGTVTFNWPYNLGVSNSQSVTVGIVVEGMINTTTQAYYARNTSEDNVVVTVSKPLDDFITGGGHIIPSTSAGTYAATAGSKSNFGFNVKYNKTGKNLQGNVNIIFRKMLPDGLHVYQIKSNAMTSLSVQNVSSNPFVAKAVFNSKANLKDITNPLAPIDLGGSHTLQMNLTDRGEPGNTDQIAVTLWNSTGSGLLFSSQWNGVSSTELILAGGNIVVRGGAISLTTSATTKSSSPDAVDEEVAALQLEVGSNPSVGDFRVRLISNRKEPITLRIIDVNGKVIEMRNGVQSGSTLKVGGALRPGTYLIQAIQGNEMKTKTVVRQ